MKYWPTQATSLATRPSTAPITTPIQKFASALLVKASVWALPPITMPANIYTAEPGTGGKRNIAHPTAKTNARTRKKDTGASFTLSQENKMKVNLPPKIRTAANSTRRLTFTKMLHQFQSRSSSTTNWPVFVYMVCSWVSPLHRRTRCRTTSRAMSNGIHTLHNKTPNARIKSMWYNFAMYLTIFDDSAISSMTSGRTSW
mmetsp:Transcript_62829/g.192167  ORF Transcript_62829/g.192167 Transcript_62829/m.192167 type:complete len:200 (-) Transcript_62829:1021-1620(-)